MTQLLFRDTVMGRKGVVSGQKDTLDGGQEPPYWKREDVTDQRGHGRRGYRIGPEECNHGNDSASDHKSHVSRERSTVAGGIALYLARKMSYYISSDHKVAITGGKTVEITSGNERQN